MAELHGQGPIGLPGGTDAIFSTSPFPIQLGARAKDSQGNEYVFCQASGTVNPRQPVAISSAHVCTILAVTGRGRVGVACTRATDGSALWVQIYGRALMQIIESGVSPSDAANGPTTLSTTVPTIFVLPTSVTSPMALGWVSGNASTASRIEVEGIVVATDASPGSVSGTCDTTANTSMAHTGAEIGVWLNYPNIRHRNYGE